MNISSGEEKEIQITKDAIHLLFDFPNGNTYSAPRPQDNHSIDDLNKELGFIPSPKKESLTIKWLMDKLAVEATKVSDESDKLTVKIFFIILFKKVVLADSSPRFNRVASMVKGDLDYKKMATMDFCQLIVEEISRGAKIWKGHIPEKKNTKHIEGLALAPAIMYLDTLLVPMNPKTLRKIAVKTNKNKETPRVNHLLETDLRAITKADMIIDGKDRPDDYKFGKLQVWFYTLSNFRLPVIVTAFQI